MPTYQYKCNTCNTESERMGVAIVVRDEQECEECGNFLQRILKIGNMSVWAPTAGGYR